MGDLARMEALRHDPAGPRTLEEANGHMADENLSLDDLYKATEVIALALHDMLK